MDLWAQSNISGLGGWRVRIEIDGGRCALTLGHSDEYGATVYGCWETRWAAIQCASHGGALDPTELSEKSRWDAVVRRGRLVLDDPRARRVSPPRSENLPPLVNGYVQPFKHGHLIPEIRVARRFAGRCFVPGHPTSPGNYEFRCFFGHYVCEPAFGSHPYPKRGEYLYCAEAGSTRPDAVRFIRSA
jgi:hypothetical protein